MTEHAFEPTAEHLQLPAPQTRVLAFTVDQAAPLHHLVLPDVPEATLCDQPVPADEPLSTTLLGSLCPTCHATAASLGSGCESCGLPLLAEFDPGLCFACTCRVRGF